MFEFCLTCRSQVKLLSEQASTTVFQKILQDAGQPRLNPLLSFVSESFLDGIKKGDWARWRQHLARLPRHTPSKVQIEDAIRIGQSSDLTAAEQSALREQLKEFIPWRKGPFHLFGIEIDTEWRCDMKWSRLKHLIAPLEGRTVLDVGSGNGYFSLRMVSAGAELVVGLEPHMAYFAQFCAIAHFLPDYRAVLLPIPLEEMPRPLPHFDTVFSMGVIYHRSSPIDHLLQLKDCLSDGGELVLETIVVDGPAGYTLMPRDRYARMSNVWFIPSVPSVSQWLERCGFINVRVVDESTTGPTEQRPTEWMPFKSLDSALMADDPSQTVEGHPSPKRAIVLANKP